MNQFKEDLNRELTVCFIIQREKAANCNEGKSEITQPKETHQLAISICARDFHDFRNGLQLFAMATGGSC